MQYTCSLPGGWELVQIILDSKSKLIIFDQETCLCVLPILYSGSTTFLFETSP